MYKHGKPIYRFSRRPLIIIAGVIILLLAVTYLFVIRPATSKTQLRNNNKPVTTTIKAADQNTPVDEPTFSMSLPGKWTLAATDWDARYHAWMWQSGVKNGAGRWFRVYEDTIPTDQAYNYLLPVEANGPSITVGQISGNCSDFTTNVGQHVAGGTYQSRSKWQQVEFICDLGNQQNQIVGTSSKEAINSVTLVGAGSPHKFFFMYGDNNFSPDYGLMANILSTFQVK